MVRTGRCSCERIRYELRGDPLFTHACHCTQCQRRSGAAFCMSMLVESDQLTITEGEATVFEIAGDTGTMKQNWFCAACGTMLFGRIPNRGFSYLRPGTLDDTSWVRPEAHIFTRSKQPWVQFSGDAPAFDEMYELADVWPEASLVRLRAHTMPD